MVDNRVQADRGLWTLGCRLTGVDTGVQVTGVIDTGVEVDRGDRHRGAG